MQINIKGGQLTFCVLAALAIYAAVGVGLAHFDVIELTKRSLFVAVPILGGVVLMIVFNAIAGNGERLWSKQGYDLNILTLGAILSTIALQIAETQKSVLPGLERSSVWKSFCEILNLEGRSIVFALLSLSFVLSIILTLASAFMSRALEAAGNARRPIVASSNYIVGVISFSFYAALIFGGV
jgi:hypothetical protein